jgi:hypothetical protein
MTGGARDGQQRADVLASQERVDIELSGKLGRAMPTGRNLLRPMPRAENTG